jgi:hypothetical protein
VTSAGVRDPPPRQVSAGLSDVIEELLLHHLPTVPVPEITVHSNRMAFGGPDEVRENGLIRHIIAGHANNATAHIGPV